MENQLAPKRECGSCSACCISLHIDEPELQKHADVPCPNLSDQGGCGIYLTRPGVCREFQCLWLSMPQLGDEWRPDISKILIRKQPDGFGCILQPLDNPETVLTMPDVLSFVAVFIEAGGEVFISIPTRPGRTSTSLSLNAPISAAIESHDLHQAQQSMLAAIEAASSTVTDKVPNFKVHPMHQK